MRSLAIACLLAVLGMPIGFGGGAYFAGREAESFRAKTGEQPCGLMVPPYLLFGSLLGGMAFGAAGAVAAGYGKRRDAEFGDDDDASREMPNLESKVDDGNPFAAPRTRCSAKKSGWRFPTASVFAVCMFVFVAVEIVLFGRLEFPSGTAPLLLVVVVGPLAVLYLIRAAAYPSGPLDARTGHGEADRESRPETQ